MKRSSLQNLFKILLILLSIGICVSAACFFADTISGMHESVQQDESGVTDAGFGAIILIPFALCSSAVVGLSLFSAMTLTASIVVGRLPADNIAREKYRRRITIQGIIAVMITAAVILLYFRSYSLDDDLIWGFPGIIVFGILTSIWMIVTLARVQVSRKLTNISSSSIQIK